MWLQPATLDDAELACQAVASAQSASAWGGVAALFAIATAFRYRDRAAELGHQTLWMLSALCVATLHLVLGLAWVPPGCATLRAVVFILVTTAPWCFAAGIVRTGVAPTPEPLRPAFDDPDAGDPFHR